MAWGCNLDEVGEQKAWRETLVYIYSMLKNINLFMAALLGSEKPLNGKRSPWILMVKNYDVFHPNQITSKHSQIKYQSRHEDELIWVIKDTRILKVCQLLQKKICWDFDRDCIRSIDQRAPRRNDPAGPHEPRLASDSKSPAVPSGPRQRAITPAVQCAPPRGGTGSGEESPSSWDMGRGRKGGRPLAAMHCSFVGNLVLNR